MTLPKNAKYQTEHPENIATFVDHPLCDILYHICGSKLPHMCHTIPQT